MGDKGIPMTQTEARIAALERRVAALENDAANVRADKEGGRGATLQENPVVVEARQRGCVAIFLTSRADASVYRIRDEGGKTVSYIAARGKERGEGATPEAAVADLPPQNKGGDNV